MVRRVVVCAMVAGVLVIAGAADLGGVKGQQPQNIIANGGFEAGAKAPDGWILVTSGGGEVSLDEAEKHAGARSLKIVGNRPTDRPRAQGEQVEVAPGDKYRIQLWARLEDYHAGKAAFVICRQAAKGSDDYLWQGSDFVLELDKANSGKGWVQYTKEYTIPALTHAIIIRLWGEMFQGRAWFDEVSMVRIGRGDPNAGQPAAPPRHTTVRTDLPRGEFCVSPNGSDQSKGSEGEPWRTIQYAVDHVGPGSVVQVRAGVYHESVKIANSGTPEATLTLRGYPGERPVLDGEFRLADGIVLSGDNVRVSGMEIRNYLSSGIQIRPRTDNATIDHNVIHHVSSNIDGTKATSESSWGIRAVGANNCLIKNNTIYLVIGRTESMGILFDVRSEFTPWIKNARVLNNLVYLCDKSGIRFANYSDTGPGGTDSDSLIEGNICVHNAYVGIETNGIVCDYAIRIRNNFVGWNTAYGMNPKQSHHAEFTHNTIYKSQEQGFLYSGEPYLSHCRCQDNLLVDNVVGSWVQTVGTDNTLEGNFYVQHAPWLDVFADRTRGWGTLWKSIAEAKRGTKNGYEKNGRQGDGNPFVNAENGDFRVKDGSEALASASDSKAFGALAAVLQKVGAGEEYGLSRIPVLNELPLKLAAFSGEMAANCTVDHYPANSPTRSGVDAAKGLVTHLTDGAITTCWGVDPKTGGWAEFDLPGDQPVPLSCVMVCSNHTQGYRPEVTVRDFAIYVKKSNGAPWEHVRDFVKQRREEGQIFLLPEGTTAKMVKLEVKTNYGDPERIEVAEFEVFGDPLILPPR